MTARRHRCACPSRHLAPVGTLGPPRMKAASDDLCDRCRAAGCTPTTMSYACPGKKGKPRYPAQHVRAPGEARTFDSPGERGRWNELTIMERAGLITDRRYHTKWPLVLPDEDGTPVDFGIYESDFDYRVVATGALVVEDYKNGIYSERWRYVVGLMWLCHHVRVREVGPARAARRPPVLRPGRAEWVGR